MPHVLSIEDVPKYADCAVCPLARATEGVPSRPVRGWTDAERNDVRVIIVMEAPGGNEHVEGKPAVGQSGQALDAMLAQNGLQRKNVFVTNAIICRPPQNRDPDVNELSSCYSRLHHEIMSFPNRHVIVAMGKFAARVMANDLKTTAMKKMFDVDWSNEFECHVVYAFHPAFVLRQPDVYVDVASVLETAVDLLKKPRAPIARHKVERETATDEATALQLIDKVRTNATVCAADIETDNLAAGVAILEIGFCYTPNRAIIIPYDLARAHWSVYSALKSMLEDTSIRWTWHNGKFDVFHLRRQDIRAVVCEDTLLLHFALDERSSSDDDEGAGSWSGVHGLKLLARKFLHAHQWEKDLSLYLPRKSDPWSLIPTDVRHEYLSYDVHFTYLLLFELHRRLAEEWSHEPSKLGYPKPTDCYYKYTIPASNALADLQTHGITLNVDYLMELEPKIRQPLEKSEATLVQIASELAGYDWYDFNPNSPQQVAKVIYDILKCPPWRKRGHRDSKVGPRTTNVKTLLEYNKKYPSPFFDALLEQRKQAKIYSTYIKGFINRIVVNKVYPTVLLHGAVTGRMAYRNPNMQNVQRNNDIKRMFIADEGHTFVISDYKQLEVRIAALLSQDEALIADVQNEDIHWSSAQDVFKEIAAERAAAEGDAVELRRIIRRHAILRELDDRNDIDNMPAEGEKGLFAMIKWRLRNAVKWVTFGVLFGRTAHTLAHGELACSESEAQMYIDNWFGKYSTLRDHIMFNQKNALTEGWVEMATGRRRRFPCITDTNRIAVGNQALNAPIQGVASELNTRAFVQLRYTLLEQGLGYPLFLVHDSIAFEILTERMDEALPVIRQTMESVVDDPKIPLIVDMAAGPNWGDVRAIS